MNILEYNAVELNKAFMEKEVSAIEIVREYKNSIEENEKTINAYITKNENIEEEARLLDEKLSAGEELGSLAGIPYGAKDNIMTKGIRSTCASKMLENFIPPYDAHVISLLKEEDALLLGKNNMDEFAVGGTTEYSYFGPTHNPLDLERVPGGSSGGSAAAVGAKEALFALGTDTGGSVRQPASYCGVVGIKPTYGMVSRYGVQSMSHSLDQVGIIARDVRDTFYIYKSIAKNDERDGMSKALDIFRDEDFIKSREEYIERAKKKLKNFKIAKPTQFFTEGLDERVKEKIYGAMRVLEEMGVAIDEVEIPHLEYALPAYYTIAQSELATNLSRFDGVRIGHRSENCDSMIEMIMHSRGEGFGEEVKRRIILGTYCIRNGFSKNYYRKALQARTLIIKDLQDVFNKYDFIISPTSPIIAPLVGEESNAMERYLADAYTVPVNLCGIPAISVPVGNVGSLSVGCQLMADRYKDLDLFEIAMALEGGI